MITPYDWQEGVGARAQYVEAKLAQGAPVIALSVPEGVLILTYRRQTRKLFEIYDRLGFGAIGLQSDVEAIRTAAVEFTSREGYQRSEQDVTIQRVAVAMSQPIKRAFSDFSTSPFVARCLFAEVNDTEGEDSFYVIDFTGDYAASKGSAVLAGTPHVTKKIEEALKDLNVKQPIPALIEKLKTAWKDSLNDDENEDEKSSDSKDLFEGLEPEVMLIQRSELKEDRFLWLEAMTV